MTENEAINILQLNRPFAYSELQNAVDKAIQALEENQQYHAYKEIFENNFSKEALKMLSDKVEFEKWIERGKWIAKRCDEINREVQQYHAIGTVEELQALKEKAEPKKVIDKNYNLSTSTDLDKLLGQKPDYERYPGCGYDRSWCG